MGCGGSRTKLEGVDEPLNHIMEQTGHEDIDKKFKEASCLIAEIEAMRSNVVDEFDELAVQTGACVYKDPSYTNCVKSFCILAEMEHPEFMKGIEVTNEVPYFTQKANLVKNQKIYDQFIKLAKGLKSPAWNQEKDEKFKELAEWANFVELEKQLVEKIKNKLEL
jgi:hypothetical protein